MWMLLCEEPSLQGTPDSSYVLSAVFSIWWKLSGLFIQIIFEKRLQIFFLWFIRCMNHMYVAQIRL